MNIAVINVKDLIKYILKFCIVIFLIMILTKGIRSLSNLSSNIKVKETIETNADKINEKSFTECLDLSMALMSYKKEKNIEKNLFEKTKIISMGAGILDENILRNTDLVINEQELTADDVEELTNKIAELPQDVTVENVTENNITPKVTNTYNTVKIDNQSDYEITENMLVPDVEITNKNDILIYHTHTCESYTQSPRL